MLGIYGIALLLSKTCAGSAGFAAHRVVSFDESGFELDAAEFGNNKKTPAHDREHARALLLLWFRKTQNSATTVPS